MRRLINYFIYSAGVLLLATALAKLVSSVGSAHILQNHDPISGVSFRADFETVGSIEIIISLVCIFGKRIGLRAGLVAWLCTNFVLYRFGMWSIGWHRPCACLGNLTDAIHVSPQAADISMKIILAYLLIGSYATLFWLWKEKQKYSTGAPASERQSPW